MRLGDAHYNIMSVRQPIEMIPTQSRLLQISILQLYDYFGENIIKYYINYIASS
jgi:hypothetical protein